jgi:hypothetical protein
VTEKGIGDIMIGRRTVPLDNGNDVIATVGTERIVGRLVQLVKGSRESLTTPSQTLNSRASLGLDVGTSRRVKLAMWKWTSI